MAVVCATTLIKECLLWSLSKLQTDLLELIQLCCNEHNRTNASQTACSCFALFWTMCVHSSCVNRFVTMKKFPCKWFRVTRCCGLWQFSALILVFVSNNYELSAAGLTVGKLFECQSHYFALFIIFLFLFFFTPPECWVSARIDVIYCIVLCIYLKY